MKPFTFVLAALSIAVTAGCGSSPTTPSPTKAITSSSSSSTTSTAKSSTSSSATPSRPSYLLTFILTIYGPIPSGESFQLFFDDNASPNLFDLCGQTVPPRPACVSGKSYPYRLGVGGTYVGPPSAPWKIERVTPSGQVIVFKQGTIATTANATITATYTYPG
jgi:hypothetical protein